MLSILLVILIVNEFKLMRSTLFYRKKKNFDNEENSLRNGDKKRKKQNKTVGSSAHQTLTNSYDIHF